MEEVKEALEQEMPDQPGEGPTRIPREVRHRVTETWIGVIKRLLSEQFMVPRILISMRIESHLEKKFQLNITYPGLSAKQALPLLGMAAQALAEKAKAEETKNGPRIILPQN